MTSTELFFLENRPFYGAVAFLLGAIVGSFINVVSLRLPRMMEKNWRSQCSELLNITPSDSDTDVKLNLAFPPSHCFSCKHQIQWWENIPVLSYLWLKGKCSSCKQKISIRYPVVELSTALLSSLIVWQFGLTPASTAAIFLTWVLITLTAIDIDTQLLPDDITLPLLWLGLILNLFGIIVSLQDAVIGAVVGYLCLWSIFWIFKLLTGKEGMGYGDFKLLAALGAWMGWQAIPCILILSSLSGSIVGLSMIQFKNRDSQHPMPFGPYLCMAAYAYIVWGSVLTTWYLTTLNNP